MQTRRQFVTAAGTAATAAVFAPQALAAGLSSAAKAPMLRGGRFSDGVMSGDPTPNAITLWSRVDQVERAGGVTLEIARNRDFSKGVIRKTIRTSDALGHTVKARVTGLDAYEQYYYRFATKTEDSMVGRFRTALPEDSEQPVKFAFWSCQDYTHGFYNAHELMAGGDYDFVVCLGDYIYAEAYHSKAGGTGVRDDRIGRGNPQNKSIVREALTLDHYRAKYSLYRSDKSLQKVQAKFPTLILWDDHEIQDNYAGDESNGGLPPQKRYSRKRRTAAEKAFFENQPLYGGGGTKRRVYRGLRFGKTVDLIVMDQRQYRDNQPCNDAVAPPCAEYNQPRDLLGRTQMDWVKNRLQSSPATWKVMANEVTIMPTKVLGGSFFTFDSWQGYPGEREELLTHMKNKAIKDVVFITGDIHTFIAGDVRTRLGEGETVALEFVGGSVTSTGLGETDLDAGGGNTIKGNDANPKTDPGIINALRGINPWVDNADFDHHGFGKVTASKDAFDVNLVRTQTIKKRSTKTVAGEDFHYRVQRGQTSIKGVHGPPAQQG
jgi:alkaline phosphatase D